MRPGLIVGPNDPTDRYTYWDVRLAQGGDVLIPGAADRPVQMIFAGKAHPADRPGQELIQHIFELSLSEELAGKVFFLENYDMDLARQLVEGVDIWLNTPRRGGGCGSGPRPVPAAKRPIPWRPSC